ncbi:hypothetical protein K8O68_20955 [Salipaludibacillus sp. CUR1]|uniref:competence protein CoiA n=1 Tax=Salipaludibacillus sp. CUR1 TaxID=2820003 RepID=UPI001E2CC7A3|nr:competence protein CoiA family protein [Salipaludibacillus sp. CUR1]MCE7794861.1 hypothetical protein [Salipaludibacillus sp. CUR1]
MYHAGRSDGQTISLLSRKWKREELMKMKLSYQFFCPHCTEQVILKLGNCQSWHFAHLPLSRCDFRRTNETAAHATAKMKLYQWLTSHHIETYLELYLPELRRRPDLCMKINGRCYVLEIQRSSIDTEQFMQRHFSYIEAGYEPVWIGLHNSETNENYTLKTLTLLDSFLIRREPVPHSIYYDPYKEKWLIYSRFFYIQPRKIFLQAKNYSSSISPYDMFCSPINLFFPDTNTKTCMADILKQWKKRTLSLRTKMYVTMTPSEKRMLPLFQSCQLNLNYFPAVCNLPLPSQYMLMTPPHLWQSWLVIKLINRTEVNKTIHLSALTMEMINAAHQYRFTFRPASIHHKEIIRCLLAEYFELLCLFGALIKLYPGVYKVVRHITVKKTFNNLLTDDTFVCNQLAVYFGNKNIFKT